MRTQIEGHKELQDLLEKLPRRLQQRVLAQALRSGAAELRKAAVKKVQAADISPSAKKKLRRAMKAKASRSKGARQGYVLGSVQIELRGDKDNDPFWWRWIDQGTQERYRKRGGATGQVRARNIFRPAFDEAAPAAIDVTTMRVNSLARREIEKLAARAKKAPR